MEPSDTLSNKNVSNKKSTNNKSRIDADTKKVISIRKEDYDVFLALDMDSFTVSNSRKRRNSKQTAERENRINPVCSSSEGNEYGQKIPLYTKKKHLPTSPPIIPPHLLHFMLNKKPLRKSSSEYPELLPKPCHTLLNHLYAMQMKDGIMTLSSTQRYRKKYVTTIFYRPVSKPI